MPTPLELETSIRASDPTGIFLSPIGGLKLKGLCVGISTWLRVGYTVSSFSVGSVGVGTCQGSLFLNVGGASSLMLRSLTGTGQMSGLLVSSYASALGNGIASLPYLISGVSPSVGVGTFTVTGGVGEPSSLVSALQSGLVSVGYSGVVSSLEIGGISEGVVSLFTVGVSGTGGVVGTPSPSGLSAPNAPLFVL